MAFKLVTLFAILILLGLIVREVRNYQTGSIAGGLVTYSSHQLVRRLTGFGLLIIILIALLFWKKIISPDSSPTYQLLYIGGLLLTLWAVIAIALIDLYKTTKQILKREQEIAADALAKQLRKEMKISDHVDDFAQDKET